MSLLKGLEISEIKMSELNLEFRIDAEYFLKLYLERRKILEAFGAVTVGDCVTDGIHTAIDYDEDSPVNLLSATSPKENYVDLSRGARISMSAHNANPRTAVRVGDVLVSTVGTIGNSAVVDESILPANTDRHIGIIRKPNYSPYLISTFLLSKFGRGQTLRETTGNVQQNLFLYKIREILLPDFSNKFQDRVERIVKKGCSKRNQALEIYKEAEDALLSELGLLGYTPNDESVSVRKFSDTMVVKRLDAEYYQPKYDELMTKLERLELRSLASLVDFYKSFEPGSECYGNEGIPFVRIADLSEHGIDYSRVKLPKELCKDIRRLRKDVVLMSKDGSVGITYKVDQDVDAVTSGAILHLTVKDDAILPDFLALVLNSLVVKLQAERDVGGSIIQHWKPSEIADVKIPILSKTVQVKLVDMVRQSFMAQKESVFLLDLAKRAVETAVEKGESEGLKILGGVK